MQRTYKDVFVGNYNFVAFKNHHFGAVGYIGATPWMLDTKRLPPECQGADIVAAEEKIVLLNQQEQETPVEA